MSTSTYLTKPIRNLRKATCVCVALLLLVSIYLFEKHDINFAINVQPLAQNSLDKWILGAKDTRSKNKTHVHLKSIADGDYKRRDKIDDKDAALDLTHKFPKIPQSFHGLQHFLPTTEANMPSIKNTSEVIKNGSDNLYSSFSGQQKALSAYEIQIYRQYFDKTRNVNNVDCKRLFENNITERKKAKEILSNKQFSKITAIEFINMTNNCSSFRRNERFIMHPLTVEELEFPIAYSFVIYKDVEQFEKLLRSIYRPQNFYCVHVDGSSKEIFPAVSGITKCFDNVFLSSRRTDVKWGKFSVLEADLICMKDLLKYKWKYYINLTGQEFPLRTNKELVEILKIYNGANDVYGTLDKIYHFRWKNAGKTPNGIRPVKGGLHITVNREFVEYLVYNKTAKDLIEWSKKVFIPDEIVFSSINHNPHLGIRGSYKGTPETDYQIKPHLSRFKNWGAWPCAGKRVRRVCIFGVGDLPMLIRRPEFFANKFHIDYQPYSLRCMEELLFNRTRDEFLQKISFNTEFYKNLDFLYNVI